MAQPGRTTQGSEPDWPAQAADRLENLVGTVRDKTTIPVTKVARGIVFGFIIAVMAVVILVMFVILLFRLGVYLPVHPHRRKVWITDVGTGAIFVGVGVLAWQKRTRRK